MATITDEQVICINAQLAALKTRDDELLVGIEDNEAAITLLEPLTAKVAAVEAVVGPQSAAIPDAINNTTSVMTQLNLVLAALRGHGFIAS